MTMTLQIRLQMQFCWFCSESECVGDEEGQMNENIGDAEEEQERIEELPRTDDEPTTPLDTIDG